MSNNLAFDHAFKVMNATQQLMVRSLVNLIEMISTSSHLYAQDNSSFTGEALSLMQKAGQVRDPEALRALQKEWADTCVKFSQSQTRMTMGFVEQFGQQVLGSIAANPFIPTEPAAETVTPAAERAPSSVTETPIKALKVRPPKKAAVKPAAKAAPKITASKAVPAKPASSRPKAPKSVVTVSTEPKPVAKPTSKSQGRKKNSTLDEKS